MDLEIELVAMEDNCEHTKSLFDSENNKKMCISCNFYHLLSYNIWQNHILFVLLPMDEKNIDSTCFHNN